LPKGFGTISFQVRNDFGDDPCTPLAVSACHISQVFVFTLQLASEVWVKPDESGIIFSGARLQR
jgi:hypothetical protein